MLISILQFLEGKKTILVGVTGAVVSYLVTAGVIDASLGSLIQTILTLIFGGAAVVGARLGISKR